MNQKVTLATIKHKKILIVRHKSKKIWSLPTVSVNGKSDRDCITKLAEKIFFQPNIGESYYYMVFNDNEGNSDNGSMTRVYFVEIDKNLKQRQGRWIKKNKSVNLTRLTKKIIKSLTEDGYL